jgi:hypothetical protein
LLRMRAVYCWGVSAMMLFLPPNSTRRIVIE